MWFWGNPGAWCILGERSTQTPLFLSFCSVTDSCDPGHRLQVVASVQEAPGTLQEPRLAQADTGWVMKEPPEWLEAQIL